MISTRIQGRLGNQLFVYAFARAMSEKYKQNVLIYDRTDEKNDKFHSHLNGYKLNEKIIFTDNEHKVKGYNLFRNIYFISDRIKIMRKSPRERHDFQIHNMQKNLDHGFYFMTDGYFPLPDNIGKNLFCDGYFQSPRYFDFIRNSLIDELTPIEEHTEQEKKMINQIEKSESVCITIRLGDYINNATHQVCTIEYYVKAIQQMKSLIGECVFFVFSDDIESVKKIFDFNCPVVFDAGKSKDYMSLDVMSRCNHFIISNSSFSWWAQYLSNNKNKTVISPSRWFAKDVPCDIMQDNWLLIDC
jgi:hypothetical protein